MAWYKTSVETFISKKLLYIYIYIFTERKDWYALKSLATGFRKDFIRLRVVGLVEV